MKRVWQRREGRRCRRLRRARICTSPGLVRVVGARACAWARGGEARHAARKFVEKTSKAGLSRSQISQQSSDGLKNYIFLALPASASPGARRGVRVWPVVICLFSRRATRPTHESLPARHYGYDNKFIQGERSYDVDLGSDPEGPDYEHPY